MVLIGMPGTGKSTVGDVLARRLGYRLIDTDAMIVQTFGHSLPELIASHGVDNFLQMEGHVGQQLDCDGCVIATGGSMVFSEPAMLHLRSIGTVVWMDTPLQELERRIAKSGDRGIAAEKGVSLASIDAVRRPLYRQYAHIHIPCAGNKGGVVQRILDALTDWHAQEP
ncbi:MAG: shikimate kinase [Candidatus Limiplasma sp.]|nr:shikimate kinase [Candidatus Limiplasma sp.]MEA5146612.1 shikimate kinase [Candidatus Limiplasma sp.]